MTLLRNAIRIAAAFLCGIFAVASVGSSISPAQQSQSAPPAQETATHEMGKKLTLAGVPDFGEITPILYRGSQPSKEGLRNLSEMGIAIVVDMRSWHGRERKTVEDLGMKYVSISWQCFHPTDDVIAKFLELVRDNPGKKIFIHCHIGDDRAGMEIAAYRMANQGWTAKEARKEMVMFGQNKFHRLICWQLLRYEKQFPERYQTHAAFASLRNTRSDVQPMS
jgi:Tyrosine phosphatase family